MAKLDFELNYWLSPAEILKYKVGDDEDIAIFLFSIMFALGDENAAVVGFVVALMVIMNPYGRDFIKILTPFFMLFLIIIMMHYCLKA